MIKIIFLGTNGWYDTTTGNTVSILIQCPKYDIILDAGNGFAKIGKYLTFNKPVYLFLSHYHLDHIIGLHTLNKFYFKQGLHIIGPKGLKKMLNTMVQKPYTFPFSKLPYPTKIYEVKNGRYKSPIPFYCKPLNHPVPTLGYRFHINGKVLTYCTDTGYYANAVNLAENADLLITECAYKRGMLSSHWPHLNPDEAARLAKTANAKKLILTHFDAGLYKTLKERKQAEKQARETFKNTKTATDNMIIIQ
ncbi:MAG TPA: MBL fold metallo-hydrolase [Marinilabiliales bacterium]|nr:MBL fold metallo-hydrolase [Marinilabiliales bacterium]